MYLSGKEWEVIQAIKTKNNKVDPKVLSELVQFFDDEEMKAIIFKLTTGELLNYFWTTGNYNDTSYYNLTSKGLKTASKSLLSNNIKHLTYKLDEHKSWLAIVISLISLIISIKKC